MDEAGLLDMAGLDARGGELLGVFLALVLERIEAGGNHKAGRRG